MVTKEERELLRELARQYAELASLDVNRERRNRCQMVNDLTPQRPPVWIDEVPWHEMNFDGQLTLHCSDPFAQKMENFFRQKLFRWKYFQADMVLSPWYPLGKVFHATDIGVMRKEQILETDAGNNIVSHHYEDLLNTEEKVEQLHCPVVTGDKEADKQNVELAQDILGDILPVRLIGHYFALSPWDEISQLRGVEPVLIDLIENPELIHKTMEKFRDIGLSTLEQMEKEDLLDYEIESLHCTPPYTKDLPSPDFSGKVLRKDIWFRSMAQMFSTVSPAMFEEFELQYLKSMAEGCGLVYYGCCEPLENRISMLKTLPNLRKVGVSPWADVRSCAEQLGGDYVYARKPTPAAVAVELNEDALRREITETIEVCQENGCPYEFVLKDISTVGHKPENLFRWNQVVQETIDKFYR